MTYVVVFLGGVLACAVAVRLAARAGSRYLEKALGGRCVAVVVGVTLPAGSSAGTVREVSGSLRDELESAARDWYEDRGEGTGMSQPTVMVE